jgi:hypothetical protein
MHAHQTLIRTGSLAQFLGVHPATLSRWSATDPKVRGCVFRRGWFSVARLIDAGLLLPAQVESLAVEHGADQ